MSESEIKACPFCGCQSIRTPQIPGGNTGYVCRGCGASVANVWNTRPAEAALRARVDFLEMDNEGNRMAIEDLRQECLSTRAERDALKARVEELEGIIASTRDGNLTALCDANNALKAKLAKCEEALREIENEMELWAKDLIEYGPSPTNEALRRVRIANYRAVAQRARQAIREDGTPNTTMRGLLV